MNPFHCLFFRPILVLFISLTVILDHYDLELAMVLFLD